MSDKTDCAQVAPVVSLTDGVPTTTTLAIAEGASVEHASVIKLVRAYQSDLEEFGRVAFETRSQSKSNSGFEIANCDEGSDLKSNPSGAGRPTEFAILNEQQTTLLFTYMKNTAIVRAFKKRLVREFYELAHAAPRIAGGEIHQPHLDTLRAYLADRTEATAPAIAHALGLTGDAQGNLTRVGLLMAQCPDWEKVRPQRRGRRAYVWRRRGAAPLPPAAPVQPKAEPAPAALPLAPLPADLHAFIFQHAHRLSAAAFDPLREWMEREARAHLAQGYSPEFVRAWMEKHVGHPGGEVLLMRARDVAGLASTLAAVRTLAEVELGEVARLEVECGRGLYGRVGDGHTTR